ncbi:hypothetical protein [Nocardia brevicatena]|uniref:hypothetical protein n=1 Tax=Nocardia brevicatena TaxID=37327 RepID=UPI00068646C4|nr:hypothetical protein [Nocardia brevicatena]
MPPRRACAVAELRRRGLEIRGDDAGSHLVVPLPTARAEHAAVTAARERGVAVAGLAAYHIGAERVFGVALGYAAFPERELPTAVRTAASCLAEAG